MKLGIVLLGLQKRGSIPKRTVFQLSSLPLSEGSKRTKMPTSVKLLFQVQRQLHQGLKQGRCLSLDPSEHKGAPENFYEMQLELHSNLGLAKLRETFAI